MRNPLVIRARLHSVALLVAASFFSNLPSVLAAPACIDFVREKFLGSDVEIRNLTDLSSHGEFVDRSALFPNSDEVLLGVQGDGSGHVYLIVGDVRYDGNTMGNSVRVRRRTTALSGGLVFRFTDLSSESLTKLKTHFAGLSGGTSISATCYHGACEILSADGFRLAGDPELPERPSDIFRRIVQDGFVDPTGRPVNIEIYQTGEMRMRAIYRRLRLRENLYLARRKAPAAMIAIVIGGGIVGGVVLGKAIVVYFLEPASESPPARSDLPPDTR